MLYKLLTAASPKKYEDLVKSQNSQDMERQLYNKIYGLNLDADAYNDLDNSKVVDSVGRGIRNTWYTITGQNDKKTISTKNMSKAVSYLHSAGYSDDQISSMSASQIKSAVNSASGGRLSFGSGPNSNAKIVYGNPYAQGNSEWANMPIGTFANGKTSTMGTGGCGPTALSAVANMYGNGMNPAQMGKYASLNGYITQGGANERLFTEGAARLGMQSTKVDKGSLKDAIESGNPTIISGKNSGPFTKAGHVVVARGTDAYGNAIVLDPSDGKIKTYNKDQLQSGMTDAWSYNTAIGYGNTINYENTTVDQEAQEAASLTDLKETLSGTPENIGGLFNTFTKFGNAMQALLGTIKGEGSFSYLYNQLVNGTDIEANALNGSGQYTTYDDSDKSQQTAIWNYFLNRGYSKNAIAGIMGAWQTESANRALRLEGDYLSKTKELGVNNILATPATLDSYTKNILFPAYKNSGMSIKESAYLYNSHYYPGLGLAQWTGKRAHNLRAYASENNGDWRDLRTQLAFADKEINDYGLKNRLNNASSASAAAKIVAKKYEGNTIKLSQQQAAANKWYSEYANIQSVDRSKYRSGSRNSSTTNYEMYGKGPSGYGPNDTDNGPTNWNDLMSGYQSATDYLQTKINDMGLGDYFKFNNTDDASNDVNGINIDLSSMKGSAAQQKPVAAMQSIYGKLHYSLGSIQNPDKGIASCASTVGWAYKKALGVNNMSASSTAQSKDNRFTTIWTNKGSGLTTDFINNYLQPGDIIYQNWNRTSNNGSMTHTEMYAGNGRTLSHGGPNYNDMGPVYRDLTSTKRRSHTMMIRRYNGFLNNTAYGQGPTENEDNLRLDNNFMKEITKQPSTYTSTSKNDYGKDKPIGFGPNQDTSNVEDKLDKIFNIITEWYLMEKKSLNTKGFGNESSVTNNTFVNNSTNVVKEKETKSVGNFTSNIDKLTQKHSAFARMYKTSI